MNTKRKLSVLSCVVCALFLSQTLKTEAEEESYERFTVRTWNFRDGSESKGKLIVVSGSQATLRLDGQGTVRVPLEKLSVKDLNWLYEYHKRRKQLSFLPEEYRKPQTESSVPEKKSDPPAGKEPPPTPVEMKSPVTPETKMTTVTDKGEESYKPFTSREWTFKDGSSYKAKFVSINPKELQLIKEPAQLVRIPLDQLSEKDMKWLFEYHRRNNLLGLLPREMQDKAQAMAAELGLSRETQTFPPAMAGLGKPAAADDDPNVIKANTEIDPKLKEALNGYRVWTDKKGQKSEARFLSLDGREIRFSARPGTNSGIGMISIPVGTLIDEDLELLREALKMEGRIDELPLAYREPLDPNLSPRKLKQLLRVNFHRKWTDISGNSVAASYVKMKDGMVTLLITQSGTTQEFPYDKFSPEDQEYVQERLKKEVAGNFFPENADTMLTPEEQEKEFRVWTDRKNRQIKGKFVRLAYGDSVAVLNTGTKEELFIAEFFSDPDLSLLKPRKQKQQDQLAMNEGGNPNASGAGAMPPGSGLQKAMESARRFQEEQKRKREEEMAARRNQVSPPASDSAPAAASQLALDQYEGVCPVCGETVRQSTPFFTSCPHCGAKEGDTIYQCRDCNRKFALSGNTGATARCPHCNNSGGSFTGNLRFWGGLVKLVIILILFAGGYYGYNNR